MVTQDPSGLPALYRLIEQEFGVQTEPRVRSESVTTAAERIMRNDPTRLAFGLYNLHTATMFANISADVSATNGISIAATPGNFTMIYKEDFHMVGLEWHAISPTSTGNLLVFEIVGVR